VRLRVATQRHAPPNSGAHAQERLASVLPMQRDARNRAEARPGGKKKQIQEKKQDKKTEQRCNPRDGGSRERQAKKAKKGKKDERAGSNGHDGPKGPLRPKKQQHGQRLKVPKMHQTPGAMPAIGVAATEAHIAKIQSRCQKCATATAGLGIFGAYLALVTWLVTVILETREALSEESSSPACSTLQCPMNSFCVDDGRSPRCTSGQYQNLQTTQLVLGLIVGVPALICVPCTLQWFWRSGCPQFRLWYSGRSRRLRIVGAVRGQQAQAVRAPEEGEILPEEGEIEEEEPDEEDAEEEVLSKKPAAAGAPKKDAAAGTPKKDAVVAKKPAAQEDEEEQTTVSKKPAATNADDEDVDEENEDDEDEDEEEEEEEEEEEDEEDVVEDEPSVVAKKPAASPQKTPEAKGKAVLKKPAAAA